MKFLDKLGLALFSIITLVLSIVLCLIAFGWMESTIFSILIGKVLISQTYTYIMVAVCVLLILLAIRCIFFGEEKEAEESDDGILLQNEDGKLLITVETLKNMVEGVINEFPDITDSMVGVLITKENNVIINVSIDVTKNTVIKDTSSKLQIKIKKAVKAAADLDLQAINVRIRNTETVSTSVDLDNLEDKSEEDDTKKEDKIESVKNKETKQVKTTTKKKTTKTKNKK